MKVKKFAHITVLFVLVAFLALEGTSWAPVDMNLNPMNAFIKNLVIVEWTWFNPLEGVGYRMNQFADGTIVALHRPKDLNRLKELKLGNIRGTVPYTVESTETYSTRDQMPEWRTGEGQENIRITLVQAAYERWVQRKIKCKAQLKATDMIGNIFEICKVAPFSFATPYGQSISDSNGGEVWIITPPASGGKQEPARGSNRPRWGR